VALAPLEAAAAATAFAHVTSSLATTSPAAAISAAVPARLAAAAAATDAEVEGPSSQRAAARRRKAPRLLQSNEEATVVPPSQFVQTMQLSTAAFLKQVDFMRVPRIVELMDVSEFSNNKDTGLPLDQPLFQPFPSDLRFQQFAAGQQYELTLTLTNMDRVARKVKVLPSSSPYFEVIPPPAAPGKIAPGVAAVYTVRFSPDQARDFADELVCVTEREKFVVPVRAIGARALVDLPDSVDFDPCVVKGRITRAVLLRNVGAAAGHIQLQASGPFSASPAHLDLAPQATAQVQLSFEPQGAGEAHGELLCYYTTGERTVTRLHGISDNANVRLEKATLSFDSTFIGLAVQRTVKVLNRSKHMARFSFRAYNGANEEGALRHTLQETLRQDEEGERDEFLAMLEADPTMQEHMSLLARKHRTLRADLDSDDYLYQDDVFAIEPVQGEVWPNAVRSGWPWAGKAARLRLGRSLLPQGNRPGPGPGGTHGSLCFEW
jgi:hydrocephalus-inducing protein